MKLEAAVYTHVGLVRQNNEDNFYLRGILRQDLQQQSVQLKHRGHDRLALFAVADGMGGEENGELASLVTVQNLKSASIPEVRQQATESIFRANQLICDEMSQNGGKRMGSTLAAVYIDDRKAMCCNVGDSRVYLFRKNVLQQISVDHTQVQQLVRSGVLTAQEARKHKQRHVLTQNIGISPQELEIEPAFSEPIPLVHGDVFLLCSDGLTDMVTDEQIAQVLCCGGAPAKLAEDLVELALKQGGRDNVTAMVVRVYRGRYLFFDREG